MLCCNLYFIATYHGLYRVSFPHKFIWTRAERSSDSEDINIYFVEFFSLDVFLQFFVVSHVRAHEMSFFIYSLCVDNLISISGFISLFSVRLLYTKQHNLEQDSLNIVFWQHWQRILAMVYLIFSFYQTHTFNMETKKGKKRIKLKKKQKHSITITAYGSKHISYVQRAYLFCTHYTFISTYLC